MRCLSNDTKSENSTECTPCELCKTKHERNCNQLFRNRLRYLKCPQTHAVFYVCLLLFMDLWKINTAPCSLFVCRLNSAYILFACSLLTFCTLVSSLLLHFSIRLSKPFLPPPSSTSMSLHICLCLSSGGPVVRVGAVVEMQRDVQHRDPAEAEALQFFGARLGWM